MIANNNKKIIGKLANRSVKFNRTKNIFVLITIILSVSLLGVISLTQSARKQKLKKQLDMVQHVIYHNVDEEQIEKLKSCDDIEFLTLGKYGDSFKLKNKMIHPLYMEKDTGSIKTRIIAEGRYPEKINEVVVDRSMLKLFPNSKNIGDCIKIKFLNGSEEEFIISGFYLDENVDFSIYPILFSKEYSENGQQLKDIPYMALCKIKNADIMSTNEFLDTVRRIGKVAGIKREDINPNDFFANSLDIFKQNILFIIMLALGILLVSVLVVYSIFYISVLENVQRFGQLRTIGTSKKQIKSMIRREGAIMFARGTPIGLLISWLISYWIIPEGWNLKNTIILSLIIAIAEFITIIISVGKPAKIASSISPVEASRFLGYKVKRLKETKELHRRLSPFSMAKISLWRNKNKSFLTLISLGIGGILFLMSTTLVVSTSLEEYSRQGMYELGEYTITFDYNTLQVAENGKTGVQMKNPIDEKLIERIKAIPEVNSITKFYRTSVKYDYKNANKIKDSIVAFNREDIDTINKTLIEGNFDYDKMIKNDEVLIARNDLAKELYGWNFEIGDKVKISYFNGSKEVEKFFKIVGYIDDSEVTYNYGWFLLPMEKMEQLFPNINTLDTLLISIDNFEKNGNRVEEELNKIVDENPYLELDTLKQRLIEYKKMFDVIYKEIVGLSVFIILFSLINLVNTIITNIISRKREFAMLQSIGLSNKQLIKMIQFEGLSLSIGNILITSTFGIVLSIVLIKILQSVGATYLHYRFPVGYFIIYIFIIIIVPIVVSSILVRLFQKESLVSRLGDVD